MNVPADLKYSESHEWVRVEGDVVKVGITDFAQSQLADLTYVDLPQVGQQVAAGDEVAVVESVKAASDVYAPIAGSIVEVNDALEAGPEAINTDPFGAGWLFVIEPSDLAELEGLLTPEQYGTIIPDEG